MDRKVLKKNCPTPWLVMVMVTGLASQACSPSPQWAGSVLEEGGVEVVSNPGVPLLGDAQGLVSQRWIVEGSDWVNPSRVHVHSGLVYIVDLEGFVLLHSHEPPVNQRMRAVANGWSWEATGASIPTGVRFDPARCAVNMAASPKTAIRPLPNSITDP